MNIGNLTVSIVAETQKFVAGITKTQGVVKSFTKNLGFLQTAVGGLGAAFTVHSFAKTADDIDKLAKASDRLNVSTENLMGLGHAADLSGVAVEGLTKALTFMQKNVGDDASSSALKRLGLTAEQLRMMRADQMFLKIAGAINQLGDASEQTNIAMELFGRSGAELLPLISEGESAIRGMMREAENLGMTVNRLDASKVEEMNDAVTRLKGAWTGLAQALTVTVAPALDNVAKGLNATIDRLRTGVSSQIQGEANTFIGGMNRSQFDAFRGLTIQQQFQKITGMSDADMSRQTTPREFFGAIEMGNAIKAAIADRIKADAEETIRQLKNRPSVMAGNLNLGFADANRLNPQAAAAKAFAQLQAQKLLQAGAVGIGNFIGGGGAAGAFGRGLAGLMGGKGQGGMTPGFALTQSGSADSYRQQARISRQNDAMKEQVKLAKDDNKEQKKHTNLLENIAGKLGGFVAANL